MSAVENKLGIINAALRALGQDKLTPAAMESLTDDNAVICNDAYDPVRLGLLRQYPFEFCLDTVPLEQVDPAGLVIANAATSAVNGAYRKDGDVRIHDTEDVVVSGSSGAWLVGNAAGTESYYSSTDQVSNPWDVARWLPGDDGAAPLPRVYPGTPRDFAFLYKRPADCLTPWRISNPVSLRPEDKIRFKPFRNGWIACDQDNAVLEYARDEEDVSLFDALFVQCFSLALAIDVYVPIKGMDKGIGALENKLSALLNTAKKVDASEQHENRAAILGRRYISL